MSRRVVYCEGPEDLGALRGIAKLFEWGSAFETEPRGAGRERRIAWSTGSTKVELVTPGKAAGGPGDGKTALARIVADSLRVAGPRLDPGDASYPSLVGVVFDLDGDTPKVFHDELARTVRQEAVDWTLVDSAERGGVWKATHKDGGEIAVRAVHWRGPPDKLLNTLPDHHHLERLVCAILAEAFPNDATLVESWLAQIRDRAAAAHRKPGTWKAAIHIWLAAVYEKGDELSAAERFLHQQEDCRGKAREVLGKVGLADDLRSLLGPE